ncbi:MAG: L-lactate dehydrogenase [Acidobacteriota bacterium]
MKIGIVGAGFVGSTAAYAMVMRGVGSELVLVDLRRDRAEAEAQDILHAAPFAHPLRVRAGDYHDLEGAGLVVVAAGANQKPGKSRLDLLQRNYKVFEQVIPRIMANVPDAILLIATNPVDVMTQASIRISGLSRTRVIGSGTILDTARYRALLSQYLGISSQSIHANVLGEHGDSEVLCWSSATAGTTLVLTLAEEMGRPLTPAVIEEIDRGTRGAAATIIRGKGATYYGIGSGIARLAQAIVNDEGAILTVSTLCEDIVGIRDVCLSMPRIVDTRGVVHDITPELDATERKALARSATILKEAADAIGV